MEQSGIKSTLADLYCELNHQEGEKQTRYLSQAKATSGARSCTITITMRTVAQKDIDGFFIAPLRLESGNIVIAMPFS